ncbi:MAG TPA: hypothetical protein VNV86_11250 [Candidatus Acidoferrum sp.]|nr:hypothetical protein [Candidatus Acidoferrum sp.]
MTPQEFEQYRHQAAHALMDLNEQCENAFRLAEWPRWSYDLEAGELVFARDAVPRVIAEVQLVGWAGEDGIWTWGWADSALPPKAVDRMDEVRAFGEREGIAELSCETLPDDPHLGWEMAAIAARVLEGKGAYRCPRPGGGVLYFVYTAIAFAPAPEAATVDCPMHGRGFPTYLCEHLVADPAQPWFADEATAENRWPDAWCARCDAVFLEEGEWNERASSRIRVKLLCHRCYEGKRKLAIRTP